VSWSPTAQQRHIREGGGGGGEHGGRGGEGGGGGGRGWGGGWGAVGGGGGCGFCALKAMSTRNDEPNALRARSSATGMLRHWVTRRRPHPRGIRTREGPRCRIHAEWRLGTTGGRLSHDRSRRRKANGPARAMAMALGRRGAKPSRRRQHQCPREPRPIPTTNTKPPPGEDRVSGSHRTRRRLRDVRPPKSMTGPLLGAAGGWMRLPTVSRFHGSSCPRRSTTENRESDCDLDYVPNGGPNRQRVPGGPVQTLRFGGHNVSLAIRRADR
jgi:3-oxoacyl-[acyl-carrier-protein] synthase II